MSGATQLPASYGDLKGRTVFISGGASGIGATLVESFAQQGALVGFVDRDEEAGLALAKRLVDSGVQVRFDSCDVCDTAKLQSCIDQVAQELGPISVLVNNAANDVRHRLEDLTPERFDELIGVNLKHYTFAIQRVVPMMREMQRGSIINFGSFGWMISTAGYPVYAAGKAGVHGLTRGLARELGRDRICINTLVPGWVMTDKQRELWVDDAARAMIERDQRVRGEVLPEHVAHMALFLASDVSRMCSGQNYLVDGGWA